MDDVSAQRAKSTSDYEAELRAANEEVYKHSLELARLTKALEAANAQQENLLHFISHEIKGYLTKSEAGFSAIAEGDYGTIPDALKTMAQAALIDVRKGVSTVMDILDASNLKKGTIAFNKAPFDFKTAVLTIVNDLQSVAGEKHLSLTLQVADGDYTLNGDEDKIRRHVVRNVIDNSIRYTPQGSIAVTLMRDGSTIRMTVQDTGVGITPEDMAHLFTEGGHGKDSIKVNVHSTGYGLYIAKQIVEAHKGKIWAESEGAGKGSKFIIELPSS
jgi:signal transduction histidine kinase